MRKSRLFFWPRRSNVIREADFADAVCLKVSSCVVQADDVGTALIAGIAKLHVVVFPSADLADVERSGRSRIQREVAATRTSESRCSLFSHPTRITMPRRGKLG